MLLKGTFNVVKSDVSCVLLVGWCGLGGGASHMNSGGRLRCWVSGFA
jgi:hypothetical protein